MVDKKNIVALLRLSDLSLYITPNDVKGVDFKGSDIYLRFGDTRSIKIKNGVATYKAYLITRIYNSVKGTPYAEFIDATEPLSIQELISLSGEVDSLPGDVRNKTLRVDWINGKPETTPVTQDNLVDQYHDISMLGARIPFGEPVDSETFLEERDEEMKLELDDENYEPVRLIEWEPESAREEEEVLRQLFKSSKRV